MGKIGQPMTKETIKTLHKQMSEVKAQGSVQVSLPKRALNCCENALTYTMMAMNVLYLLVLAAEFITFCVFMGIIEKSTTSIAIFVWNLILAGVIFAAIICNLIGTTRRISRWFQKMMTLAGMILLTIGVPVQICLNALIFMIPQMELAITCIAVNVVFGICVVVSSFLRFRVLRQESKQSQSA
jgi:hypothetical protein